MKVNDQVSAFRKIILALFDETKSDIDRQGFAFPEDVIHSFPLLYQAIARSEALEDVLPSIDDARIHGGFDKRVLCLKAVNHGGLLYPCLSVEYNFGCSIPEIKLQLGILLLHEGELKACGFRLESAHGLGDSGGRHHYYHVQMVKSIAGANFPPQDVSAWTPDSEPTFPLDAENAIELLFCLIVGLYGRTESIRFIQNISDNYIRKKVLNTIEKMKLWKFEEQDLVYYWKVFSEKHVVYVDTRMTIPEFSKAVVKKYERHEYSPVTQDDFEAWNGDRDSI